MPTDRISSQCDSKAHILPPAPVSQPHFIELDSLRAVGCIAVTVYHAIWLFRMVAGSGLWLYELLGEGGYGFEGFLVFFIISGYVIPRTLRGERVAAVKRFAIGRFFRLYLPFWLTLAVGSLAKCGTLWDIPFFWGLTMMPSLAKVSVIFGHFWALEVTMAFYILISLIYLIFGSLRLRILLPVYFISLLLSLSRLAFPLSQGFWGRFPLFLSLFFFGSCMREVIAWKLSRKLNFRHYVGLGVVPGAILMLLSFKLYLGMSSGEWYYSRQFILLLIWVLMFLFWLAFLANKLFFLKRIGRESYSIYLWHWVIMEIVVANIKSGNAAVLAGWSLPVYVVLFSTISLIVGDIAYRWVEEPIGRLGKRIAGRGVDRKRECLKVSSY